MLFLIAVRNNRTSIRYNMDNKIIIESIYKGQSSSYLSGGDYLSSIAIDPDADVSSVIQKIAGTITPVAHETLSVIDGNPMWVLPNSKNDEHLIYTDTGKVYFLDGNLAITGSVITLTNASGNGAVYYNGYYYLIKDNDLDRIECNTKVLEQNLLANHITRTYVLTTAWRAPSATSINFGEGQTYQSLAQYISGATILDNSFNRIRLQLQSSSGTHTIRIRVRTGGSTTQPTGSVVFTQNITVTTTKEIFTLQTSSLSSFYDPVWIEIDKETSFGTGEHIIVSSTRQDALSGGNAYGYDGSVWAIPSSSSEKNLRFQLYFDKVGSSLLNNEQYPTNGLTSIPNHASFAAADDKLYVSDVTSADIGILHGFRSFGVLTIYETVGNSQITIGSILLGNTSGAEATILDILQKPFVNSAKNSNGNAELLVFNPKGSFAEDELVNIGGSVIGKFQSFVQGKSFYQLDYNQIGLPIDYYPTAISNIGSDISILAIKSKDNEINQGNASMFLWDRFDDTVYREIKLPFPNATALLTHNGFPFIWGGDNRGYSFSLYRGGDQIDEIFYVDDGHSPFAGAVAGENNRILWGTDTAYPETSGSVLAYGSRNGSLVKGIHNIARTPNNKQVTSLAIATKGSDTLILGSDDLLSKNGGNASSIFRTKLYSVPKKFNVKSIALTLVGGVTENTNITVTTYVDNETSSKAINVINATNYDVGTKKIVNYPEIQGEANFFIEFKWGGEAVPIQLPIVIEITNLEQ